MPDQQPANFDVPVHVKITGSSNVPSATMRDVRGTTIPIPGAASTRTPASMVSTVLGAIVRLARNSYTCPLRHVVFRLMTPSSTTIRDEGVRDGAGPRVKTRPAQRATSEFARRDGDIGG